MEDLVAAPAAAKQVLCLAFICVLRLCLALYILYLFVGALAVCVEPLRVVPATLC